MNRILVCTILLGGFLGASGLVAKEPAEEFLQALRQRELHEVAEEYLNYLEAHPALAGELKDRLLYEQAVTLMDKADTMIDTVARMKELDRASEKLNSFQSANPQHPLAGAARIKRGTVLLSRGKAVIDQSNRPTASDKAALRKQAQEFFNESIKVFDAAAADFEKQLKEAGFVDPKEKQKIQQRDQVRNDLVLALLYSGIATYEASKCHDAGTKENKETLIAAANKFKATYDRFRKRLAGLLAGMWQGRCYQEAGELKQAIGLYEELLAQLDDSNEDFRNLKSKVIRLQLEAWTDKSQAKHEEAIKRGEEWLDRANTQEEASREGLGIRYYLALHQHMVLERDKAKPDANKNLLDKLRKDVIANAKYVSNRVGEFRKPAQELLSKYRSVDDTPATFAEARERGREYLDAFELANVKLTEEERKGNEANKETLAQLTKECQEAAANAVKFFRMSLRLTLGEKDLSIDEVNAVRYYLSYLFFRQERYYESGLMGEFIAAKYPQSPVAKQSATLALAAYRQAYNDARADDRQFDSNQLQRVAAIIAKNWPQDDLAYTALLTLGDLAIREKQLPKAREYLEKIPAGTPKRAEADLVAGRAIWAMYQSSVRQDPPPPEAALKELQTEAEAKLKSGTEAGRKALAEGMQPSESLLTGELALAQLYVSTARPDLALAILEAKNGCLELVKAKHPATLSNPIFPRETFKAALQAYVRVQKVQEAESMMTELEKTVEGGDAARQLVQIYVQLGREIEDDFKVTTDPAKRDALLKGFEVFLKQIGDKATSLNQLGWVAQTFVSLGNSLGTSPKAKEYYTQAIAMLDKILKHPDLKPESKVYYQLQMARARRRMGDFKAAADLLYTILSDKEKNRVLELQKEMCYTYQEWADSKKDPSLYQIAIVGYRDPKTKMDVIWGWATISVRVQRDIKQKDTFHEARLNLADCRLKQALTPANVSKRKELLEKALGDIRIVYKLSAEMGGETWKPKYDRLCKDIQTAAGLPALGLKALDDEAAKARQTAASAAK